MKVILTFLCLLFSFQAEAFTVHYETGFYVPLNDSYDLQLMDELRQQLLSNNIALAVWHNTQWQLVCDEVNRTPEEPYVLIGHSFGVGGVLRTANCLKSKVPNLIAIDYVRRPFGGETLMIPANVQHFSLFNQTQDWLLRGEKHMYFSGGQEYKSTLVQTEWFEPHLTILHTLVQSGLLLEAIQASQP